MSQEVGQALFGLLQAAVGAAMLLWPQRMRAPWRSPRFRRADARVGRGVVIVERLTGLAFLVTGSLFTYFAVVEGAAPDASRPGLARFAVFIFAVAWSLVGAAMALWPAHVRSITNPDWAELGSFSRAASSLSAVRITGLVFIAISVAVLLTLTLGR